MKSIEKNSSETKNPKPLKTGPLSDQAIGSEVLVEKYAKGGETTIGQVRQRVARALAAVELPEQRAQWEAKFFDAQQRGFIPA